MIFTLVCFFIVGLSLYSDPWNTGVSCALTVAVVPVYYLTMKMSFIPNRWKKSLSEFLLLLLIENNTVLYALYSSVKFRFKKKSCTRSIFEVTDLNFLFCRLLQPAAANSFGSDMSRSPNLLRFINLQHTNIITCIIHHNITNCHQMYDLLNVQKCHYRAKYCKLCQTVSLYSNKFL